MLLYAIILGLVQGITEFFPVSSTGHLVIVRQFFHIQLEHPLFWDAALHAGTAFAVLFYLKREVKEFLYEIIAVAGDISWNIKTDRQNRRSLKKDLPEDVRPMRELFHTGKRMEILKVLIALVPTYILGYSASRLVPLTEKNSFAAGIGLLITAVFLLVADRFPKEYRDTDELSYADMMWVGIAQGVSVFPGISRLAVTLFVLLLMGISSKKALKFSLLLSIPTILAAALYELLGPASAGVPVSEMAFCLIGASVAGITGYCIVIRTYAQFHLKHFRYYSGYCFAAAIAAILLCIPR